MTLEERLLKIKQIAEDTPSVDEVYCDDDVDKMDDSIDKILILSDIEHADIKPKQKLLSELIESLKYEPEKWKFNNYTAMNNEWGIALWIANIPILNLCVYAPTEVKFSLIGKIKLHRAMSQCRAAKLLKSRKQQ